MDTCVLVAGLRSKRGLSHRMLRCIDQDLFELCVSVPLVLEYEAVAQRHAARSNLTANDVDAVIDYLCAVATKQQVFYLWRPILRDPKDDMVLELAVAAACKYIVTFNNRDFQGAERFGIEIVTPRAFLEPLGVLP
jgi:putative PIN family toxin of toxin-antitoxin system